MLYGYETWSLLLRKKCKPKVFEKGILRRIFGYKGDENKNWRRFHNEKLHSMHPTDNIMRVDKSRRLSWGRVWSQNKRG